MREVPKKEFVTQIDWEHFKAWKRRATGGSNDNKTTTATRK